MSGTITLSGQQQFDPQGNPLTGGLVYMLQSGTVVPQNGFKDIGLVNAYTNPITLDASGRIPPIYFVDGTIRIRLTDRNGVLLLDFDNLPVLGGSTSGAIVDTTDPNARYNTGDFKIRYGTGALAGFVRANGLTIGPASSGATERSNADCQALFVYLWGLNDPNLPVAPSRGGSAAADWASTSPFKTIQLPDLRGRVLAGVDGMGASLAGRLSTNNIPLVNAVGSVGGAESFVLDINSLPQHNHNITVTLSLHDTGHSHSDAGHIHGDAGHAHSDAGHVHSSGFASGGGAAGPSPGFGNTGVSVNTGTGFANIQTGFANIGTGFAAIQTGFANLAGSISATADIQGNQQPKFTIQPTMIVTVYIRL
jgi:microcystin-dependent protein